jgi:hypothetical protein
MYFWNVKQLIHDLKTHQVKQSQFKNYYIASSILILVSFFFVAITPEQPVRLNLATFVVNLGLLISWTNAIFKANGGEQGQQFLNRFFALYLPIVLKTLVIFVVAVILIELIWTNYSEGWSEPELEKINEYKDAVIDPIFSCVVYWRIYRAMLKIQEPLEN